MTDEVNSYPCAQCGKLITDELPNDGSANRKPCPQCGSTTRALSMRTEIVSTISATVQLELRAYPPALLSTARSLIDGGQFSIAVVVAHMACEIATERSLSESLAKKGIQYLEEPVADLLNGYNLGNDRLRKFYTALTNNAIQKQPFWQKFQKSAERRNNIVHRGVIVEKIEAEESFVVASELIAYLKKE